MHKDSKVTLATRAKQRIEVLQGSGISDQMFTRLRKTMCTKLSNNVNPIMNAHDNHSSVLKKQWVFSKALSSGKAWIKATHKPIGIEKLQKLHQTDSGL